MVAAIKDPGVKIEVRSDELSEKHALRIERMDGDEVEPRPNFIEMMPFRRGRSTFRHLEAQTGSASREKLFSLCAPPPRGAPSSFENNITHCKLRETRI
jgi:hypothetical protein